MILLPSELQAARKARGLSQGDLARISGVHTMLISKLERGAGGANCSTMERLTVALQIVVSPPAFPVEAPEEPQDPEPFPCPNCGSERVETFFTSNLQQGIAAECLGCGHTGPERKNVALAVEAWNAVPRGAGVGQ